MAKRQHKCKGWSIWNSSTCTQQGSELVGGGQYNYWWSGGGWFCSNCIWKKDKVRWWRKKHYARDTKTQKMPKKVRNWWHSGQKLTLMMWVAHLEKLVLFNMSNTEPNNTIDIQKRSSNITTMIV